MKKVDVVINGRGLDLPMNGIPRYMREILFYLDTYLDDNSMSIEVVIPENSNVQNQFRNISVVKLKSGILWDYLIAEPYAKKNGALYVNLASKGTFYRHSICTIHDIRVLREKPRMTCRDIKNRIKIMLSYTLAVRNAKDVVTVSHFSKNELIEYYSLSPDKIHVIGNGWEHLKNVQEDETIFDEFPEIVKGVYYFSLGSIAPHKNFKWIIENKKRYPQFQYVVMGKVDTSIWDDTTEELVEIIYVGYQSDDRMLALMKNAKALVFPSVYEGFGIPPLEALACGVPAIVADIPVMHEIFSDSVYYIDEFDYATDLDQMIENECVTGSADVLGEHSWKRSAEKWFCLIKSRLGDLEK